MGLLPLEFKDCLTDSPYFRDNLASHEKELETTSQTIKGIIKEVKDLLNAAKGLSRAQRNLAKTFSEFKLETIGTSQTDDEIIIANSLKEFGRLLTAIEDERDRMLENAYALIEPIEKFRKENIGAAKEKKKRFEKETAKYCQTLEKHLSQSSKKTDSFLKEGDVDVGIAQKGFFKASLEYVLLLQKIQEGKKTEFVETILRFMYGWLTFYHQGHEVAKDFFSFNTELQVKLQKTRENLNITHSQAEHLMKKMLVEKQDPGSVNRKHTREGYLFLLEKKKPILFAEHLGSVWNKHYCHYTKEERKFTMIPFSQNGSGKITHTDTFVLQECVRRMSESIERRHCFDLMPKDKAHGTVYTFQALNEEDYRLWLNAMDGKEPYQSALHGISNPTSKSPSNCLINEDGLRFVRLCIDSIEKRGLDDQGLYRTAGVASKVQKLTQLAFDQKQMDKLNLHDPDWEVKTIASALKNYLRSLPEPLMTFRLHTQFIGAAKLESVDQRIKTVEKLVQELPMENHKLLKILVEHLYRVADNKEKNLMSVSNLGVCFGPTLLRPEEETVAAILEIKFYNVIVEILIEHYSVIFSSPPKAPSGSNVYEQTRQEARALASPSMGSSLSQSTSLSSTSLNSPMRCPLRQPPPHDFQITSLFFQPPTALPSSPQHQGQPQEGIYGNRYDIRSYTAVPVSSSAVNSNGGAAPQAPLRHQYVSHTSSYPLASTGAGGTWRQGQSTGESSSQYSSAQQSNVPNYSSSSQPVLSSHGSVGSITGSGKPVAGCRVRTLYACVGENEQELSFEPNQIITDVRPSRETGWLEGVLSGKRGLIPENHVQYLPN